MPDTEHVIIVDEQDRELGTMEKLEAHQKGVLHRAFSVCLFNSRGEMLLQRRALEKYHSGGLWTNTCCSHPRPGESPLDAAHRRLREEMGIDCPLEHQQVFVYKAAFDNGLTEHELDHVFVGYSDETPDINPEEVMAYGWKSPSAIREDMALHPEQYTAWFRILMQSSF